MKTAGTRRSTFNKRRKGRLAIILPWLRRFGFILCGAVLLSWGGAWFFLGTADTKTAQWARQKTLEVTSRMGFTVRNVLLEGRVYSDAETLKSIINVQPGEPLFSFDPGETKTLIERMDWIRRAHVERRLPDTIYIAVEERKPVALWQKDKKLKLVDTEGKVIEAKGLSRFRDLILVLGDDAPIHAPALVADLSAEPALLAHVKAARRAGRRRWDLILKEDITVKLPEEDTGLALQRLSTAQAEDKVLDKDITEIDLREPGRMTIRTRPGAVQDYKISKETGQFL